jgi:hypothetical protein
VQHTEQERVLRVSSHADTSEENRSRELISNKDGRLDQVGRISNDQGVLKAQ